MPTDPEDAMAGFAAWLCRRVVTAVEAGEIPADLLAELVAELEAARERSHDEGQAAALDVIVERLGQPLEEAASQHAHLEVQTEAVRLSLLQRIAEAWLQGQRKGVPGGAGEQSDPMNSGRKVGMNRGDEGQMAIHLASTRGCHGPENDKTAGTRLFQDGGRSSRD